MVVGVHAPEFAFEKDTNNVKNAIAQYGIHYPVAQDNNLAIWQAYNNEYWPAEYLINQKGEIVEEHFGEGDYDKTEADIRQLLGITSGSEMPVTNDNLDKIQSPEMYFGTDRMQYLSSEQTTTGNNPSLSAQNYVLVQNPDLNSYSLGGTWKSSNQSIQLIGSTGQINLKFNSAKVFMVASSQTSSTLNITVDGKKQPDVLVGQSKLYTLFDSQDYSDHEIIITINGAGFEAFTFTFG